MFSDELRRHLHGLARSAERAAFDRFDEDLDARETIHLKHSVSGKATF
jgi:hypothetical protein